MLFLTIYLELVPSSQEELEKYIKFLELVRFHLGELNNE